MSNKNGLNRFGTYNGSEPNTLCHGQFLSFETEEQELDDGTDLEYHTQLPPGEERVELYDEPYYDHDEDDDYRLDLDETEVTNHENSLVASENKWFDDQYFDDDFIEKEEPDLDEVNIKQAGGRLDKSHKIRRLKIPKADSGLKATVTFSDLPARWQARGRDACKHEVQNHKAKIAKVLSLKRTNHRRARDTIRSNFLTKSQEVAYKERYERRLLHNMIYD